MVCRVGKRRLVTLSQGRGYSAEATALFARFTTPPTTERKALIDALIVALKAAGVWSKLDALYVYAAADSQAARRNWIADVANAVAVSGPTFTVDRGFTGDGAASYLTAIDYAALTKAALNAAMVGVWVGTSVTANNQNDASFANNAAGRMNLNTHAATGAAPFGAIQSVSGNSFVAASSVGLSVLQRTGSSTVQFSKDGGAFANSTQASTGDPSGVLQSGRGSGGSAYSTRRQQAVFVGAPLSDAEAADVFTAFNDYMTAIGAA